MKSKVQPTLYSEESRQSIWKTWYCILIFCSTNSCQTQWHPRHVKVTAFPLFFPPQNKLLIVSPQITPNKESSFDFLEERKDFGAALSSFLQKAKKKKMDSYIFASTQFEKWENNRFQVREKNPWYSAVQRTISKGFFNDKLPLKKLKNRHAFLHQFKSRSVTWSGLIFVLGSENKHHLQLAVCWLVQSLKAFFFCTFS